MCCVVCAWHAGVERVANLTLCRYMCCLRYSVSSVISEWPVFLASALSSIGMSFLVVYSEEGDD